MSFSNAALDFGHPNAPPAGHTLPSDYYENWNQANAGGTNNGSPMLPRPNILRLIRTTVMPCLDRTLFSDARIEWFSGGANHQLYRISSDRSPQEYLMRIASPFDPYYKTESEIATMSFVRANSYVPVPNVIAYSSSSDCEIGFEWILMEKMNGVPYADVQSRMSMEAKINLVNELATAMAPLMSEGLFPLFGSLYHGEIDPSEDQFVELFDKPDFLIGPMTATRFTRDLRRGFDPQRGPFRSFRDLAMAELEAIGQQMENPAAPVDENERYNALSLFRRFRAYVHSVLHVEDGSEDNKVFWHNDLSSTNILVDPYTFRLAGVIDWESTSIIPAFETNGMIPSFLEGREVLEMPQQIQGESLESLAMRIKEWEKTQMRRKWVEVIKPRRPSTAVTEQWIAKKNEIRENIARIATDYRTVKRWMDGTQ